MEKEFSPMNIEFYGFLSSHGCPHSPTLIPTFTLAIDTEGKCIGIETYLDTYWGYHEGIPQEIKEELPNIF